MFDCGYVNRLYAAFGVKWRGKWLSAVDDVALIGKVGIDYGHNGYGQGNHNDGPDAQCRDKTQDEP